MAASTPVLFIHGLWLHARSWDSWLDHFTHAGYAASAPGWPGDPDTVAGEPGTTRTRSPTTASTTWSLTTPA